LELEKLGLVEPDAPVVRFVPELSGTGFGAITIENLLTQASGLARGHFQLEPVDDIETLGRLLTSRLHFVPGSRRKYSHWGHFLLGRVITAATGTTPEAFITERILRPLGMNRCQFDGAPECTRDLVEGYWSGWRFGPPSFGSPLERSTHVQIPNCAGGLIGTADEAVLWLASLISGESTSSVGAPTVTDRLLELRARKSYVYTVGGFAVDVLDDGVCHHFSAFSSGSSCFAFMIPRTELVGIALCNNQAVHHELRHLLSDLCREIVGSESLPPVRTWNGARELGLEDEAATDCRADVPTHVYSARDEARRRESHDTSSWSDLVGQYHYPAMGMAEVTLEDGHVYIDYGDKSGCELRPRRGLRFTHTRGPFRREVAEFHRSSETGRVDRFMLGRMVFRKRTARRV
tara:strand:+ start:142555 stop:143769 length:1215 start_codon:yes stop_codon:yes gene_type:complete